MVQGGAAWVTGVAAWVQGGAAWVHTALPVCCPACSPATVGLARAHGGANGVGDRGPAPQSYTKEPPRQPCPLPDSPALPYSPALPGTPRAPLCRGHRGQPRAHGRGLSGLWPHMAWASARQSASCVGAARHARATARQSASRMGVGGTLAAHPHQLCEERWEESPVAADAHLALRTRHEPLERGQLLRVEPAFVWEVAGVECRKLERGRARRRA